MKIGEIANQIGISAPAIRFYESVGLVPNPPRASGWRQYGSTDLERLKVVHSAREAGFSIKEIKLLLADLDNSNSPSKRWQKLAETKLAELDTIIKNAENLKALIKKGSFCSCSDIGTCIHSRGQDC